MNITSKQFSEIRNLYVNCKLSCKVIGIKLGLSTTTINRAVNQMDIVRSIKDAVHLRKRTTRLCELTLNEKKQIENLYLVEKIGLTAIGRMIHKNPTSIWRYLKKIGKNRTWSEAQYVAVEKGRAPGFKNRGENNGMWRNGIKGSLNSQWRGGRNKTSTGYILLYITENDTYYPMRNANRYILEHRLVMAKHLGRLLTKDEAVHHLNGIRDDNRIKNLALVSRDNHPVKTLMKLQQIRIRELEVQLSQQKLL